MSLDVAFMNRTRTCEYKEGSRVLEQNIYDNKQDIYKSYDSKLVTNEY